MKPAHWEIVGIVAKHIASAAEEAPDGASSQDIVDVALDVAHSEFVNKFGLAVADEIVNDERICGTLQSPGLCDHLLKFFRAMERSPQKTTNGFEIANAPTRSHGVEEAIDIVRKIRAKREPGTWSYDLLGDVIVDMSTLLDK